MSRHEVILDARGGHDGIATGGNYGSWAHIWASRTGIADVIPVREEHRVISGRLTHTSTLVVVEVVIHEDKMQEGDYVLVEHKRSPNPYLAGSSHREGYELLAGTMPAWADFPARWADWVRGPARDAAIRSLLSLDKIEHGIGEKIDYAMRKTAKGTIIRAWEDVAAHIEDAGLLRHKPRFSYTWTGVRAMPIQIARAVDWRKAIKAAKRQHVWVQPFRPREWGMPQYSERKTAVLLASGEE